MDANKTLISESLFRIYQRFISVHQRCKNNRDKPFAEEGQALIVAVASPAGKIEKTSSTQTVTKTMIEMGHR